MSPLAITAETRTRMEGGVEQLEALVLSIERIDEALRENTRLTEPLQLWRDNQVRAADARHRAARFPELAGLLNTLAEAEGKLDTEVIAALKELEVEPATSLASRVDQLAPHLPIVYRGTLEGSALVWGGVVLASLFGAVSVLSSWPWLAAAPIAAGVGGLLWDRARSRTLLVSQQVLIVGSRSVRLAHIEHIVVPRSLGAYRCKLEVAEEPYVELPAITALLDILREAGVEVRYE